MSVKRRTRSVNCAGGCGRKTRHRSGFCADHRPPRVMRTAHHIEIVHHFGSIQLSESAAIELSNLLIDAVEGEQCE